MKIAMAICLLLLLAPAVLLSQKKGKEPQGTAQSQYSQKETPKAPLPSDADKKLMKAFGARKQFCCQLPNGCISGPANGSAVCKEVGGTPFAKSVCVAARCVDP